MPQIKRIETGEIINVSAAPVWVSGTWECGDQRFMDADKSQYVAVPVYPVITPPQMRFLFTSPERIAIRANVASASPDPVLQDFFTELDDPQLREVDLNLASVQGAIAYSIHFVGPLMNPPYTGDDIAHRVSEMMSGKPQ